MPNQIFKIYSSGLSQCFKWSDPAYSLPDRLVAECTWAHVIREVKKETKIGLGAFSEEKAKLVVISQRRECRRKGLKCEWRLDRSPANNQEEAGDESWEPWPCCCALLLCLPAFFSFSPALLSDCRKAPVRLLSKKTQSLSTASLLSCRLSPWPCRTVVCMFFSALFPALSSVGMTSTMQDSEIACRR